MTGLEIPTGGREYPVHEPGPRSLTDAEARAAVDEHLAVLLRVLVDLPPDQLDLLGGQLLDVAARMVGTAAEPFRPVHQVVGILAAVVHAHPDAAAGVADRLDRRG